MLVCTNIEAFDNACARLRSSFPADDQTSLESALRKLNNTQVILYELNIEVLNKLVFSCHM